MEAQREQVNRYVTATGGNVLAEFSEVESAKGRKHRPQLTAAIELAKKRKAKLVVAKLDRLSRNMTFMCRLRDMKVDFVAADFRDANKLTASILAAVAEHEADMISARTKAAL